MEQCGGRAEGSWGRGGALSCLPPEALSCRLLGNRTAACWYVVRCLLSLPRWLPVAQREHLLYSRAWVSAASAVLWIPLLQLRLRPGLPGVQRACDRGEFPQRSEPHVLSAVAVVVPI